MNDIFLDILAMEAREIYFIDNSEKPFLILCDNIGVTEHHLVNYTLYFADLKIWNFNKLKNCRIKIQDIIQKIQEKGKNIYIQERGKDKRLLDAVPLQAKEVKI